MSPNVKSLKQPNLDATRQILRYVKDTINYDLLYKRSEDYMLVVYCIRKLQASPIAI